MRRGFTLIELLVVIVIVLIISIVALPAVLPALRGRQMSESARLLQGALNGSRDAALNSGAPAGLRLLPDPAFPLVYRADGTIDPSYPLASNRVIPIAAAPNYTTGAIFVDVNQVYPDAIRTVNGYSGVPCLVCEESVIDGNGLINEPTSWFWNIRIGDQIQINNAGAWYTVVGPMMVGPSGGNPELFVNVGPSGTRSPWSRILPNGATVYPEFLLLVNGVDDNGNGWKDEGFDGVDNNAMFEQLNGLPALTDDPLEWETEKWLGAP